MVFHPKRCRQNVLIWSEKETGMHHLVVKGFVVGLTILLIVAVLTFALFATTPPV